MQLCSNFGIGKYEFSNFVLVKIVLAILGILHFHMNFRISCQLLLKKGSRDFDRAFIDSVDQYGEYCHLNNSKFSNLYTQDFFNFFKQFLQFSVYKAFTSLFKFIPVYFILLDATVNETVFLNLFSDCSLLVYRITAGFCVSILKPATLLNSFTSPISFLWIPYNFLYIRL